MFRNIFFYQSIYFIYVDKSHTVLHSDKICFRLIPILTPGLVRGIGEYLCRVSREYGEAAFH